MYKQTTCSSSLYIVVFQTDFSSRQFFFFTQKHMRTSKLNSLVSILEQYIHEWAVVE